MVNRVERRRREFESQQINFLAQADGVTLASHWCKRMIQTAVQLMYGDIITRTRSDNICEVPFILRVVCLFIYIGFLSISFV